jgi:hypothetical protein
MKKSIFFRKPVPMKSIGLMVQGFPMQKEMEKFVRFIVQKLKDAELFASQGGPIILSQVQ